MMCKVLTFGCIAAVILMTAAYGAPLEKTKLSPAEKQKCLEASITDLARLKDIDNNFLDFYTPNDKQYANSPINRRMNYLVLECNQTTLACFLKELKVLEQDVEENDKRHVINIRKNLQDFKDPDFSNPTCKKCESNEKKKFAEFHQEMTSFLQSMWREIV